MKFDGDACLAAFAAENTVAALDTVKELDEWVRRFGETHGLAIEIGANVHPSSVAEVRLGASAVSELVGRGVVHLYRMGSGPGVRLSEPGIPKTSQCPPQPVAQAPAAGDIRSGGSMSALPSGLVAFLLLDVESSTREWNVSAPAMGEALQALDRDIQSIVAAHSGAVIKARGEAHSHFCVSLHGLTECRGSRRHPASSGSAACGARRLLVREANPRDDDYVGSIVNHGARIRSTGHGGQIVATAAVVDVAQDRLSPALVFRTLGPHQVPDLPRPVELFQLHGPGLRRSFPPLRTQANRASAVMAVVIVDEVGSVQRLDGTDHELVEWQATLIRTLRDSSDRHDGRYLKLVGEAALSASRPQSSVGIRARSN